MPLLNHAPIYVETLIHAPLDVVWARTQDPVAHTRWDARFSAIEPQERLPGGGYRFRYTRSIPGHVITGTGTSIGERTGRSGTTSALRFSTSDRLSPMGEGRGYWRYVPVDGGTRFITGYDYAPAWGRLLDGLLVRRALTWLTALSFDRLRIWAEQGVPPEDWPVWRAVFSRCPGRPRASRCLFSPEDGRVMRAAPKTLRTLETP